MNSTLRALLALLLLVTIAACDGGPRIEDVRSLQAEGRFEASLEPLRALLEASPEDPEVNFLYGRALNRTTSSPIAVWSLKKAGEDPAWHTRAYLELATTSMQNGDAPGAIENASIVLEAMPNATTALSLRGMAYLNEGQAEEALVDFDALLEQVPDDDSARASRAAALLVLGRVDEAAAAIAAIGSKGEGQAGASGSSGMVCATRATLEAERGNPDTARASFEACVEAFPLDAMVIGQSMAFYDAMGERDRATEILEAALAASPGTASYRTDLADRAVAAGDEERAEAILLEGTERPDPRTRAAAWTDLTNFYLVRDELEKATEAYRQAISATSNPSQLARLTLADLLARSERHDEALEIAKTFERDAYRGLIEARVHLNENRPKEALARLDEVLPAWPNNAGARYYAARAAEQLGDFERAIEEYRQSIRSGPEQTEAALRLSKLYFHAGSFQNAWNSAAQHFRRHRTDPEGIRMMLRAASSAENESVRNLLDRLAGGPLWPTAVAMRAERLESTEGAENALASLDTVDRLDFNAGTSAEALRKRVELLLALDRSDQALAESARALEASPESGAVHEIRGLVLEKTGAPTAEVRDHLERAVALAPDDWRPLHSLGVHLERAGALEEALDLFRRATATSPWQAEPGRGIARVLSAQGKVEEAEMAWETHLREQPWDATTALALTRIRLASGRTDIRTVELAERAVLFRGGDEALAALVEVHESRGESARAEALVAAAKENRALAPTRITPIEGTGA
ncbi:unnamed protein product [Discosporangium mesarthrocarpum]